MLRRFFVAFQKETFTLVAIIPPVGSAHRERGRRKTEKDLEPGNMWRTNARGR
jgi:hypothetical protein